MVAVLEALIIVLAYTKLCNKPKRLKMSQNNQKQAKTSQHDPRWAKTTETTQNGPKVDLKWAKMSQNNPKQIKTRQNNNKQLKMSQGKPELPERTPKLS